MFFRTSHDVESSSSSSFESSQLPCHQFTFLEIQVATQNFDESFVIGRGGFGKVYKGTITTPGATHLTAAIKRLDVSSDQGAPEFWAEVKMLSNLRHCHLVSLIGYCNDGQEMILVYEYMSHGTLEDHLHKRATSLTWMRRLRTCIGAARGLDYLHTGTGIKHGVIHRDVKSSNVLLDDDWAAKVSDFGLSKIGPINQQSTYVNTLVKGTFGYFDPDYYATGRLTRKSDVFAFGVIMFEVLCGKKAVDESLDEEHWGLVQWVQDSIKEGRIKQIVDSSIRESVSPKGLKKFTQLANQCLHGHPKHRPTMAQIVVGLEHVLALQEKANNVLKHAGRTIFGKNIPMFVFPSNGENKSDGDISIKSLRYLLDTIQGENHVLRRFDFDTIRVATKNFSEWSRRYRKIIYKGRLQNGQEIMIDEYVCDRFAEDQLREVSILVNCEHENLAKLLGYCIEGTQLYLIYEFAFNAALSDLVKGRTRLDWNKLYKIILSVARVLAYLHKQAPIRIIHGNVGPLNILLDESFDPRLSDFRFATAVNETDCVFVDNIRGTIGQIAPECHQNLLLSTKADVYSFGMLVFQIIADDGEYTLRFPQDIERNWVEGTLSNVINPRIDADSSSVTTLLEIGLLCVHPNRAQRPTMEEVVSMLLDYSSLTTPLQEMLRGITVEPPFSIVDVVDDYDYTATEDFLSDLYPR